MQSWKQPSIKGLRSSTHKTRKLYAPATLMKEQNQCTQQAMAARSGKKSRRANQEVLGVQVREVEKPRPCLSALKPASAYRNSEGSHYAFSANPSPANFGIKAVAQAAPPGTDLSL
jgi:hypothetical protein